MCKSHFMIMIHSEWYLLLFTCLLWDEPVIGGGGGGGGGGGVSKNRKKEKQEKKEKKLVHKEAWERLCKSHLFLGFV